jgi:hypothetical protein
MVAGIGVFLRSVGLRTVVVRQDCIRPVFNFAQPEQAGRNCASRPAVRNGDFLDTLLRTEGLDKCGVLRPIPRGASTGQSGRWNIGLKLRQLRCAVEILCSFSPNRLRCAPLRAHLTRVLQPRGRSFCFGQRLKDREQSTNHSRSLQHTGIFQRPQSSWIQPISKGLYCIFCIFYVHIF